MSKCPICGKDKSRTGRKFDARALDQHIRDAHLDIEVSRNLELVDTIANDDIPDGAYFALAWELDGK